MKIFILENNITKVSRFLSLFSGNKIDICMDAQNAINALYNTQYDIMFLNHDLGDKVMIDSFKDNNGYTVAKELHNTLNVYTPVIIHSYNILGSNNMFEEITKFNSNVEKIPFGLFDKNVLFLFSNQN